MDINNTPYSNYVIEIFNPTASPINASNYQLEFLNANSLTTIVPLRGSIAAKSTYAISHSNAENNVKALMDMDTNLLDFSIYTEVKLVNRVSHAIIDAFGEPISQATITFNYLLFMQDPPAYLSQYNLTLADLDHIDLRRGFFVSKGTPVFNANNVVGTWAFYTGTDHSDLTKHTCLCNEKPGADPTIGYAYALKTLDEKTSLGNSTDALDLNISNPTGNSIYVNQILSGGNAILMTHIRFNGTSGNVGSCMYSTKANCDYAKTMNNMFSGQKNIFAVIQPATVVLYNIDNASAQHQININGNSTVGLTEYEYDILPITIYPSVTSDILNVRGNIDCRYSIITTEGKVVKQGDLFNANSIDVSTFAPGMYIINFYNYSGTKTAKFIKQ